jgi:hypothetical protein
MAALLSLTGLLLLLAERRYAWNVSFLLPPGKWAARRFCRLRS